MGSVGNNEGDSKGGNSTIGHNDTEIQTSDTQSLSPFSSSSSSGEELNDGNPDEIHSPQNTVPFDSIDTFPINNSLFETQLVNLDGLDGDTQVLDDLDFIENVKTQCLDDEGEEVCMDSDVEGSDRTEVLTDVDAASGDGSERRPGDDDVCLEKRLSSHPCEQIGKDFVVDSNASTDKHCNSESFKRDFTSVRVASLRASGLAACKMISKGTNAEPSSIPSNSQSRAECVHKDNGMIQVKDPTSIAAKIREVDQDHETWNWCGNMNEFRDETKCSIGSSAVRKLIYEDTLVGSQESATNIDSTDGGTDFPLLLACENKFAGLSYVDSQEPGVLSQANALDVVDKFLSVNNVELSQEADPKKTIRGIPPPVSSAKGPQRLAKIANLRSPVEDTGIFDWVDSREDEGGGDFFNKRKDVFFEGQGCGQRSLAQPQNSNDFSGKRGRDAVAKFRERNEGSNLHKKIIGLPCSESKLMLHDSKENDKIINISETKKGRDLAKEFDELLNAKSSGQQSEGTSNNRDPLDIYDVGFDTQMAAEAMEALFCGAPANHNVDIAYQGTRNVIEGSPRGVTKNKACSRDVPLRRRASPDFGGITRQSKRTKMLECRSIKKTLTSSRKHSKISGSKKSDADAAVNAKMKKRKSKAEPHLNRGNTTIKNESSRRKSSKSVECRKAVGADRGCIKEVDGCNGSATSNGHPSLTKGQLQEEYRTSTPIAHRTRQCRAVNSLNRLENSSMDSGGRTNDIVGIGSHRRKRKVDASVDAIYPLTIKRKFSKISSNRIDEVRKNMPSQEEQLGLCPQLEEIAVTSGCLQDALSYPRGKRTSRNKSVHLNKSDDLDGPSKVLDGEVVKGQSITRHKISAHNVSSIGINLDMKRRTRSSTSPHTLLSSLEKNSKVTLQRQVCKDLIGSKASMPSGRKGDADSIASAEDIERNAKLVASPKEKIKPSGLACTTPVSSTTPINAASPICMGNEYHKQSCKKSLSRSSLMRELTRLGATDEVCIPALKDVRSRRDMANVRVLFSNHLDEDIIKQQKKISARLGISVASSSLDATHFIADKFARTRNMLEAIALGKPVVTHLWLESCGQASCFIDEKNFILRDSKKEKEIGFSMPVSLARACQCPLLQGRRVFVTPNIKPSKELIASLVKAVQGQAVERIGRSALKEETILDDLLVLSCEEDYTVCVPLLEKGATIYSSELLLNGIVIQKLDYERHRIFTDNVKRTRSTLWLRKDGEQFLPVTRRK